MRQEVDILSYNLTFFNFRKPYLGLSIKIFIQYVIKFDFYLKTVAYTFFVV